MQRKGIKRGLPVGLGASAAAVVLAVSGSQTASAASTAHGTAFGPTSRVTGAQLAAKLSGHKIDVVTPTASGSGGTVDTSVAPSTAKPALVGGASADTTHSSIVQVIIGVPGTGAPATVTYQFCAGTLIAANKVLTAASCVAGLNYVDNTNAFVWTGSDINVLADIVSGKTPEGYGSPIVRQWVDPSYTASQSGLADHDLAVLTTADSATGGIGSITPVAGANSKDYAVGATATAVGWGATAQGQNYTGNDASGANLAAVDDSACSSAYSGYVSGDMTCFGNAGGTGGAALCTADAGDPLIADDGVIGIASASAETCDADSPSAFTRLSPYTGTLNDLANSGSLLDGVGTITGLGGMAAMDSQGDVWDYSGNGSSGVAARQMNAFSGFYAPGTRMMQADLTRGGVSGLLAVSPAGELSYLGFATDGSLLDKTIGGGWNEYNTIVPLGDAGGAPYTDLVARDASGKLWLYLGKGDGTFAARQLVGGGWNAYTTIIGNGDFNGDGHADLMAVDANGYLWFYQGTGNYKAPFATRVQIGRGYHIYNAMSVISNANGNGLATLVGRDKLGDLWAYKTTGDTAMPIGARTQIGHGFNIYTSLF